MNRNFLLSLALVSATLSSSAQETQTTPAGNPALDPGVVYSGVACPGVVYSGSRLAPRAVMLPCSSAEQALAAPDTSPYVIRITDWKVAQNGDDTVYSARFKKHYTWDERSVILRTQDVTSSFAVAVNGTPVGYSQSGMGYVDFDLTDATHSDYNDITITVFNTAAVAAIENHPTRGTLRGATIISQPTVRIQDVALRTVLDGSYGVLSVDVVMQSTLLNPKDYTVAYELHGPAGDVVSSASAQVTCPPMLTDTVKFTVRVPDVERWNHESPNLYKLVLKTSNEGRRRECSALDVGFRGTGYGDGALTIDSYPVRLYAADYTNPAGYEAAIESIGRLKSYGYNTIMGPGHPLPDFFYRACNAVGMYVVDCADIGSPVPLTRGGVDATDDDHATANDPAWEGAYVDKVEQAFYASRNNPCVVVWSLAERAGNGYCLYEGYLAFKRLDASRPVIYGGADGQWNNDPVDLRRAAQVSVPAVTVSIAETAAPTTFALRNNTMLTTISGTMTATLRPSGGKRVEITVPFTLAPGETLSIPAAPGDGRKRSTARFEVTLSGADSPTEFEFEY